MNSLIKYKPRQDTRRIVLHDSHTPPEIGQATEVSRWHLAAHDGALRMGLLSIGYHYIVERDGTVVKGRDRDLIGSHAPGHNLDSIGICLVGGRDHDHNGEDNFTYAQRKAVIRLCAELRKHYQRPLTIVGHTEIQRYFQRNMPPCPMLDMDILREDIELYEKGIML